MRADLVALLAHQLSAFAKIASIVGVMSSLLLLRGGDVDHDGDADLLLCFQVDDTGIACGGTAARLSGMTYDGEAVIRTDAIRTVRCQR